MKKIMLCGAVALAGIISSCSSDETLSSNNQNSELQEIKIGFGASTVVSTRGTGTVGGTELDNEWNGQKFNIFMLERGTLNLAKFENEGAIYDNEVFVAPDAVASGIALPENNRVKYYPTQGAFDFWGYRLDGCETGTYAVNGTNLEIPFKMDGSQDIMVGKAVPTDTEKANCKKDESSPSEPDRIYSAFAARRNIQPNITFNHLLSRLTFNVIAGTEAICNANGVKVDSIKVVSKSTGKLIAAYTGDVEINQIEFDETSDTLSLRQRALGAATNETLIKLSSVTPVWADAVSKKGTPVGEALLVAPTTSYKLIIYLSQTVTTDYSDPSATTVKKFAYEDVLKTDGGFLAGKSYNVKITVYGLSEIKVNTTLTPWVDGGNINMTPEDNGLTI